MKIKYDVISDVGRKRSNNEDMALIFGSPVRDNALRSTVPMAPKTRFTAIVADGMGGYGGGEIASEIATATFSEFIDLMPEGLNDEQVVDLIKDWFEMTQAKIFARQNEVGLQQMGTTITGIFTYEDRFFMINAGDSRVYCFRNQTLRQRTKDHSERERTGDPTVPSNLIYNALGVPGGFVDVTVMDDEFPVVDGDVYIVCSDGLSDMLPDRLIESILTNGGETRRLVDEALEAGGLDNCTVILFSVEMDAVQPEPVVIQEPQQTPTEMPIETPAPTTIPPIQGFVIDEEPGARVENEAPKNEPSEPVPPVYIQQQYEDTLTETTAPTFEPQMEEVTTVTTVVEDGKSRTIGGETPTQPDEEPSRMETAGKLLKELGQVLFGKKKK